MRTAGFSTYINEHGVETVLGYDVPVKGDLASTISEYGLMRISPSNVLSHIGSYFDGPDAWFKRYKLKTPRDPQTHAMMAGSAFDSYVKGALSRKYHGVDTTVSLVEEQCEDVEWGTRVGLELLRAYSASGAWKRLCDQLDQADEIILDGDYGGVSPDGIPVTGKPDLMYHINGVWTIFDWKVNGYMSSAGPKPGYVWGSKTGRAYKGTTVEVGHMPKDWDLQTTMYSWMHPEVGPNYVKAIHQIACSKAEGPGRFNVYEFGCPSDTEHDKWVASMVKEVAERILRPDTEHEATLRENPLMARLC